MNKAEVIPGSSQPEGVNRESSQEIDGGEIRRKGRKERCTRGRDERKGDTNKTKAESYF